MEEIIDQCVFLFGSFLGRIVLRYRRTYLILREFRVSSPTDDGQIIGLAKHFHETDACIEVWWAKSKIV
jgi:hypothetical protein